MVGLFLIIELADLAGAKGQFEFLSRKLMISFASAKSGIGQVGKVANGHSEAFRFCRIWVG